MNKFLSQTFTVFFLLTASITAFADDKEAQEEVILDPGKKYFEQCMFNEIKRAKKSATLAELENLCEQKTMTEMISRESEDLEKNDVELGAVANRIIKERRTAFNPYVITPHRMNYILPVHITNKINSEAYQNNGNWEENLTDTEAKFQISIKVPLMESSWLIEGDQIFFAFTLQSWWQLYSDNISKPFRETNYQPEFFYFAPLDLHPFGGNSAFTFGMEHQSNGRSQHLSRSWNRIYFNYIYEKRNFALSFKPWYRIKEETKSDFYDEGDDNPDILDYMGHFELTLIYKYSPNFEISFKGRENFATHNGYAEVGVTFPLWGKLKGYAQFSSGYGESLIDYNYNQTRFGLGIALTDIL
ncbi:phospholipase A [Litorilituus lipolyticus]|nr:phospholipase A [Litorilituus lipolyticus]